MIVWKIAASIWVITASITAAGIAWPTRPSDRMMFFCGLSGMVCVATTIAFPVIYIWTV